MSQHEQYEELCAMAAVGEITTAEQKTLKAHLTECASCSNLLADMGEIHSKWLPEQPGFEIKRGPAAESRLRQLILNRATAEGAHFSEQAYPQPHLPATRGRSWWLLRPNYSLAASLLIVAVLGAVTALMRLHHPSSETSLSQTPAAALQSLDVSHTPTSTDTYLTLASTREEQEALERSLKKLQIERERLEQRLQEAEHRVGDLQQTNSVATSQVAGLQQQLDSVRKTQSKAEEEIAMLKSSLSDKDTDLILTAQENKDLRDKLNAQTEAVDREREFMSAGREIRDLIAARNLHIIDVFDTNGDGKTQKVFGRVFYTEGKSLVFYAYDLPVHHPATKYAFYAWGKRDDQQGKVRNLGIFYNDDQTQKRWVLKITDPQVLSAIDSVFVTLEPLGKPGDSPTGRKLLSAYLGTTANHP